MTITRVSMSPMGTSWQLTATPVDMAELQEAFDRGATATWLAHDMHTWGIHITLDAPHEASTPSGLRAHAAGYRWYVPPDDVQAYRAAGYPEPAD